MSRFNAAEPRHTLVVSYKNQRFRLPNIDGDKYSYFELLSDICEVVLNRLASTMNMSMLLTVVVPGKNERFEIGGDRDICRMFELHRMIEEIHIGLTVDATVQCPPIVPAHIEQPKTSPKTNKSVCIDIDSDIDCAEPFDPPPQTQYHSPPLHNQTDPHTPTDPPPSTQSQLGPNIDPFDEHIPPPNSHFYTVFDDVDPFVKMTDDEMIDDEMSDDENIYALSEEDEEWKKSDSESDSDMHSIDFDLDHEVNEDKMSNYESGDDEKFSSDSESDVQPGSGGNLNIGGREFVMVEGQKIELEQGLLFPNVDTFRKVLKEYAIQEGVKMVRDKNEKRRVTAHCADINCGWKIHALPLADGITYKINTLVQPHTCQKLDMIAREANSIWLATKIVSMLRNNPQMKIGAMQGEILDRFGLRVGKMQMWRAKVKAMEEIDGSHSSSYGKLLAYAEIVRARNSGSLVKIEMDRPYIGRQPVFRRFFMCLSAQKNGFKAGCRPFIGLDGCHLKGPYGGVLLAAIGLDANNGIFPLAIGVVESETKDSWSFFLHYLHTVMGSNTEDKPWTFISDRQKGIVESLNDIVPEAAHRVCARHLLNNFKAKFPGLILRKFFWQAARAYNYAWHKIAIDKMKEINKEAVDYLLKIPASMWCRHAFDPRVRSDHVTNNISESFNNWIGDLRDKPVLTLLEQYRSRLMNRLQNRLEYHFVESLTFVNKVMFI